jgi:hypothetical protein
MASTPIDWSVYRSAWLVFKYLRWDHGIPAEIWMRYARQNAAFVKEYGIQPASAESLPAPEAMSFASTPGQRPASELERLRPRPYPGGIRTPHLHIGEDIYLLTQEQWKKYSEKAVSAFRESLTNVQSVNFQQFMALSEALGPLA